MDGGWLVLESLHRSYLILDHFLDSRKGVISRRLIQEKNKKESFYALLTIGLLLRIMRQLVLDISCNILDPIFWRERNMKEMCIGTYAANRVAVTFKPFL